MKQSSAVAAFQAAEGGAIPTHGLHLRWCSGALAKFACQNWHYTQRLPNSHIRLGVWDDGVFFGVVTAGVGSCRNLGDKWGVFGNKAIELQRVALRSNHEFHVSQVLAVAVRLIKRRFPAIALVISFADSNQGHYGGIYQAAGWVYLGQSNTTYHLINGSPAHPRSISCAVKAYNARHFPFLTASTYIKKFLDTRAGTVKMLPKYKYAMPLHNSIKRKLLHCALPYPKRGLDTPGSKEPGFSP